MIKKKAAKKATTIDTLARMVSRRGKGVRYAL